MQVLFSTSGRSQARKICCEFFTVYIYDRYHVSFLDLSLSTSGSALIGLTNPDNNNCASLSLCDGLLKWLDDGTEFVYAPFMTDIPMGSLANPYFAMNYLTGTMITIADPTQMLALCQVKPVDYGPGMWYLLPAVKLLKIHVLIFVIGINCTSPPDGFHVDPVSVYFDGDTTE